MSPYIQRENRAPIANGDRLPETPGELNFAICNLADEYLTCVKGAGMVVTYADVNEVIGVLECAKLEIYRRLAAPVEDDKCHANGDVFDAGKCWL